MRRALDFGQSPQAPLPPQNFKFPHESQKDIEAYKTLSPAIHLEVWARHFKHEYMKNFSKNLIES